LPLLNTSFSHFWPVQCVRSEVMLAVNILQWEDRLFCGYEPTIRNVCPFYPENWSSFEMLGHTYEYQTKKSVTACKITITVHYCLRTTLHGIWKIYTFSYEKFQDSLKMWLRLALFWRVTLRDLTQKLYRVTSRKSKYLNFIHPSILWVTNFPYFCLSWLTFFLNIELNSHSLHPSLYKHYKILLKFCTFLTVQLCTILVVKQIDAQFLL